MDAGGSAAEVEPLVNETEQQALFGTMPDDGKLGSCFEAKLACDTDVRIAELNSLAPPAHEPLLHVSSDDKLLTTLRWPRRCSSRRAIPHARS